MSKPEKRVVLNAKGKEVIYWYARFSDPQGKPQSKSFSGKGAYPACKAYLISMESAKQNGTYIDTNRGKITIGDFSQTWFDGAILKPSTRERYAGILRTHVVPRWGDVRLSEVGYADVQGWVSKQWDQGAGLASGSVRKNHRVLSLILSLAVQDERLFKNPAAGIQLPPPSESEQRCLTHEELGLVANHAGPEWRLALLFLGYTGLRFGEMAAMRVGRLDLNAAQAAVRESVTPVKGVMTWGTPKNHASREVPIPGFLIPELRGLTAGKDVNELVFLGARGAVMRAQTVTRAGLSEAGTAIGKQGFHPHELRHTAASLAIAGGADIKVVQQMLGHQSATMTWDLYGHLFPNRLQEVAEALDQGARLAGTYKTCTKSDVIAYIRSRSEEGVAA